MKNSHWKSPNLPNEGAELIRHGERLHLACAVEAGRMEEKDEI